MAVNQVRMIFSGFDFGSAGAGEGAHDLADVMRAVYENADGPLAVMRDRVTFREIEYPTPESLRNWQAVTTAVAEDTHQRGGFPLFVLGSHMGVLPLLSRLDRDTLVLQLDGHLDINAVEYPAGEVGNGNFMLHVRKPQDGGPRCVCVGYRSQMFNNDQINSAYVSSRRIGAILPSTVGWVDCAIRGYSKVWLDVDWDVLDPAFFPAVNNPAPCGLNPVALLYLLMQAAGCGKLVGASFSEYVPALDRDSLSAGLASWLLAGFVADLLTDDPTP